ncbi:MAG: universal stress protein [Myxococcales bacterium]|nr:universal stress protein [Myxococcales bacterium]
MAEFQKIMIPYDFSEHAQAALHLGVELARRLNATLTLVHVIQPPAYAYGYPAPAGTAVALPNLLELQQNARSGLRELIDRIELPKDAIEIDVLEGNNISEALCQAAEKHGADLLVMGTHGRTGLAHAFIGSVAERTLRSSPCPVLTVKDSSDGG